MYFLHCSLVYSLPLSFHQFFVITKFNETNYKNDKNELSDNHLVNVCFESNIIDVSFDTWWLDSGATIHACNSMQKVIRRRNPTNLEQYVCMREGTKVKVVFLGVRLQLSTNFFLELQDVTYIPSIRRNLISISILDRLGYSFLFGTRKVKLYRDSLFIDTRVLCGSLYILELSAIPYVYAILTINTTSSSKRLRLNEKSSTHWHKRLGHISR